MRKLGDAPTAVKSVTYDTKLLIVENKKSKVVEIGKWIDQYLDDANHKGNIVNYGKEDANMELLDISALGVSAYVPSCDEKGHLRWCGVTNITRHDPSEFIYKIKTKWGREVSVVQSKSLLVWNSSSASFEEKNSDEVAVGDKLPISFNLTSIKSGCIDRVDLREYLPIGEYIYGTDYNQTGGKIIKPFDILDGNVYLRCARRNSIPLKDTFELNRENGFFIGIYLAEGNTCKDYIGIANNDLEIQQKVSEWFHNNGISSKIVTKPFNPNRPGTSTSVRGYSTLLVQFLENFLGKYSQGKYIPNEAFLAPDDFVKGLIDGYISGDGCVTDYHVVVSSVSKDLISGVSNLLTRYGIFSKVSSIQQKSNNIGSLNILPRHTLSIQSKYVYKFAETFTLTHKGKQEKLTRLVERNTLGSMAFLYEEQNDVILDRIVSIEKIPASSDPHYEKVYDITVPDTLNFQLFNGLNVRDTSDTGYIQRKLVKAMEDCKVYYDLSVRNASGSIVQFYYGEDGMDASKIEHQPLPSINMDLPTLRREFLITPADVDSGMFEGILSKSTLEELDVGTRGIGQWDERMAAHFRQILEDRTYFITQVFKNKNKDSLMYPIAFQRILTAVKQRTAKALGNRSSNAAFLSDLHPAYVLDTIERLQKTLTLQMRPDSATRGDPATSGTYLLHALLRLNLSPKRLLFKYGLDKDGFDFVVQKIQARFYESLAHPSEMVGVIAAQSIGEPCTQLTLNTFHSAGISAASTAVRGVPRLRELLSITKNMKTPIMKIYVSPDASSEKTKCMELANELRTVRFKDIVESCKIYFDPCDGGRTLTNIEEDRAFMQLYEEFRTQMGNGAEGGAGAAAGASAGANANDCQDKNSPWLLRLEFNKAKMLQFKISMLDVHRALGSFYDWCTLSCVFSDDNADKLIFRVRLKMDDEAACDDMLTELRALEHNILETVTIKGVKNIEKVSMHEEKDRVAYRPEDGTFVQAPEWVIDTQGSNLIDVLGCPFVDSARSTTNNVPEIYQILGVEAARMALFNEITDVLDQVYVDYRHIALLVDTMTNKGNLLSIDRHGINRGDIGPLAKCSFEEVNDMLVKAGIFAEADKINGVSANIILGQIAPCGTGDGAILMDESMLEDARDEDEDQDSDEEGRRDMDMEFERPTIGEDGTDTCAWSSLGFNDFKLPEPDAALQQRFVVAA